MNYLWYNKYRYAQIVPFCLICLPLLFSFFVNAQDNIPAQLPPIAERGVSVKDGFGNDLIGVSGMAQCGDYLFLVSERIPQFLYFGKFTELCTRAMGVSKNNAVQVDSIPVYYDNNLDVPQLGEGRGFETVEFCPSPSGGTVFLSYEADDNDLLYKGNLKCENGMPKSVEIVQTYNLPENPEGTVHNAGWEAIAYDSSLGNLIGIYESRFSLDKMVFEVKVKNIPLTIVSNLPPVRVEYRVTDMTCISSGKYIASVFIWKEAYRNLNGAEIFAEIPRFCLVQLTRNVDEKKQVRLTPVILKTFQEADDAYGEEYLNFEGITVVNETGFPSGVLIINDNDPPYIKFGNKRTPPSILRFLSNAEIV